MIEKEFEVKRIFGENEGEEIWVRVFPDRIEISDFLLTSTGIEEIGSLVLTFGDWKEIKAFVEEVAQNE